MESPALHMPSPAAKIEEACRILADTLLHVQPHVKPGATTAELDAIAEDYILSRGGYPAFKGYVVDGKAFPGSLCISVNEEVVHGIPGPRVLVDGDIVTLDCGVKKDGYYGDSAYTFPVGTIDEEKQKLLRVTQESLMLGIEQATAKNKVYDIARAVQTHVEKNGFSVVRELVGHGIGKHLHEDPALPNFVPPLLHRNQFPNTKLQKGKCLAIEPMVNAGTFKVRTAADGWTIYTADGRPSAHFEHTVLVTDDKPIILTLWN